MSPSKGICRSGPVRLSLAGGLAVVLAVAGCQGTRGPSLAALKPSWDLPRFDFDAFEFRSQSPRDDEDTFETKVETPMIGDYTTVAGLNMVVLEGVSLVTGLNGTGGDAQPSVYRTALTDEMRRRGVKNLNQILRSPDTALVVVRAYLPPLIRKGDRFDIEVRIPGNGGATSLNGGWLMPTLLAEQAIVPGRGVMEGHTVARASGPILISTGEGGDQASLAGVLRRGKVLGGGVSLKDRDLTLYLRNDFRSGRNITRIADRIGQRFFHYNRHGLREPLAKTTYSDQKIILKIHPRYRDNFPRYLQVIRNIAFRETEVAQRVRIHKLREDLHRPETSELAAIKLEAIGQQAVPVLKTGLKSENLEVRFHAATALAYLGEPDGLKVLAEAARSEPAFRIFAFAAMATVEDAEAHVLLRELMNETSAETRYGAFRSLSTLDKNDPFIRGEKLNDEFTLHVLATEGPPMVHLTGHKKAEIVLFGDDQRLSTPLALRAGNYILVTARPGSETVVVSRYEVGRPDQKKVVSNRLADVIRTVAEFGASYPDVAQMLAQADRLLKLPGRIEIDALPEAGRVYYRPRKERDGETSARVGGANLTPNLFSKDKSKDDEDADGPPSEERDDEQPEADEPKPPATGKATLTDVTGGAADEDESPDRQPEKPAAGLAKRLDVFGLFHRENP